MSDERGAVSEPWPEGGGFAVLVQQPEGVYLCSESGPECRDYIGDPHEHLAQQHPGWEFMLVAPEDD